MGNYLTHTVGSTPLGLDPFIGTAALTALLADLSTTAQKQEAVDEAIEAGEGVIDSYIGSRYSVPVSPVPEALEAATGALAVEHLYQRGKGVPEIVRTRADNVRAWLKDVAKGLAILDGSTLSDDATDASGVILSDTEDAVMSRENLSW